MFKTRLLVVTLVASACGGPSETAPRSPTPTSHDDKSPRVEEKSAAKAPLHIGKPGDPAEPPPKSEIPAGFIEHRAKNEKPSVAYTWVEILREVTGREVDQIGARPTIISRQMAMPMTAMYDAWAAFDDKAVGTRLGGKLRRPAGERTQKNKEKAISYATYRVLVDLFPQDKTWLGDEMKKLGYDPADASTNTATPQGIGNVAAQAILDYRHHDGANQLGDEVGSPKPEHYADFTFYEPKNPLDKEIDPDRWTPIPFSDGKGGKFYPGFLTPHWYRVKPFALERADQFRPPPPPKVGSQQLKNEVDECIAFNASLSLERKSIVEFMRDGPRSTGQSGHWLQFAQDVSRRDKFGLDQDVKLFFVIANTAFDAFIASWDGKRAYDSSRPYALVRHYYRGQTIMGYLGPGKGVGPIPADQWQPYSPATFVTPPFPGYPSGHSTVSGACSKMLELLTGSDRYGAFYRHHPGQWTEANQSTKSMQAMDGHPADKLPDNPEVVLVMPTFSSTAEMAGVSRVMGGYHIQADNVEGLKLGRNVATYTWPKYRAYFDGTAPAPK